MGQFGVRWYQKYLFALLWLGVIAAPPALAQITPDNTLGAESSRVTPNVTVRGGNADRIDGGAGRGANLFHSFSEFNVNEGQRVYFANPAGVQNILTRVTGNTRSDIMGTLGVDGGASLFLLNPNGIIFGQNARLDVSGSFTGTTANGFTFPDGSVFSATAPGDGSLLSVAVPLGVQYGAGSIDVNSRSADNFKVGQNLTLSAGTLNIRGELNAGNDLTLEAQNRVDVQNSSSLTAGRDIVVRSPIRNLADGQYTVGGYFVTQEPSGSIVDFLIPHAQVILTNDNVELGNPYEGSPLYILAGGAVKAGEITINAPDNTVATFPLSGGQTITVRANPTPNLDIRAGSIRTGINWEQLRGIQVPGQIINPENPNVNTSGVVGTITSRTSSTPSNVQARTISTFVNTGNAGSVNITAAGDININATANRNVGNSAPEISAIDAQTGGRGNGGNVTLTSSNGRIDIREVNINGSGERGGIYTQIINGGDTGNGGAISLTAEGNINTGLLDASAQSGSGNSIQLVSIGGNIDTTRGSLFSGSDTTFPTGSARTIFLSALHNTTVGNINTTSGSNGGDITINTGSFLLNSGHQITTIASNGGNSGAITINARDNVQIVGIDNTRFNTAIFTNLDGKTGQAGNITINAREFSMTNAAQLQSTAKGGGNSGAITINASDRVSLDGSIGFTTDGVRFNLPTSLFAEASNGSSGGSITITTGELSVTNGAQIKNTANGTGQAGNVTIHALDSVTITGSGANNGSQINSFGETTGGNIHIITGELTLANANQSGGNLTVSTNNGTAGSITIEARNVLLQDNGQITATSTSGRGGTIILRGGQTPSGRDINIESLQVLNGEIAAQATGANGLAGNLIISADAVKLRGTSTVFPPIGEELERGGLFVRATGTGGSAGNLTVNARQVTVANHASISASNVSSQERNTGNVSLQGLNTLVVNSGGEITASTRTGRAGNVAIGANNSVEVNGRNSRLAGDNNSVEVNGRNSRIAAEATGVGGSAGNLTVDARQVTVANHASISASNVSSQERNTGNIRLQGLDALVVNSGGEITASTRTGRAGNVEINVNNSVRVSGARSRIAAEATRYGGVAGNLTINAQQVTVANGASISASNVSSQGRNTGNVRLQGLDTLLVNNGGEINASTATGRAGNVEINANDSVEISGRNSRLAVEATRKEGEAGNLTINTDQFLLQDGATATVESPQGLAGNLTITTDSATLNNATLKANIGQRSTDPDRSGGNIVLNVSGTLLRLQDRSEGNPLISANATNGANGGNITLNVGRFVLANANDDSDITANAVDSLNVPSGNGGQVTINANTIFGLERRDGPTDLSDITATSQSGNAGIITLNTLNIDPTRGLGELPIDLVDASTLVANGCVGSNRRGVTTQGEFTQTGRGGLSAAPNDTLTDQAPIDQLSTSAETPSGSAAALPADTSAKPLVEAQGLARNASGKVSLVPSSSAPTFTSPVVTPNTCNAP